MMLDLATINIKNSNIHICLVVLSLNTYLWKTIEKIIKQLNYKIPKKWHGSQMQGVHYSAWCPWFPNCACFEMVIILYPSPSLISAHLHHPLLSHSHLLRMSLYIFIHQLSHLQNYLSCTLLSCLNCTRCWWIDFLHIAHLQGKIHLSLYYSILYKTMVPHMLSTKKCKAGLNCLSIIHMK